MYPLLGHYFDFKNMLQYIRSTAQKTLVYTALMQQQKDVTKQYKNVFISIC